MCGITGWIDWEVDLTKARTVLEEMAQTLSCRGPDDSGFWLSPRAALAHRRLVVIDPAGGAQPMIRRRGEKEYVITYNGELYNTPELRQELAARGYQFFGHSDTEVLLNAYIEWGTDCVECLNGIFAFAVWSTGDQRLFLARDWLGVKPLFYTQRGSAFLFGSEPKSLLAHPAVPAEVDAVGLAEIFLIGLRERRSLLLVKGWETGSLLFLENVVLMDYKQIFPIPVLKAGSNGSKERNPKHTSSRHRSPG